MKKPAWMRLVGWLALVLWALAGACFYSYAHGNNADGVAVLIILLALGALVLSASWFVCSALTWGINRQVRTQAAVLRDVMGAGSPKAAAPPPRRNGDAAIAAAPGTVVPVCFKCQAPSVLHCCRHEANVCWRCMLTHDSDECTYIQSVRVVPADLRAPGERRFVATSPIAGAR